MKYVKHVDNKEKLMYINSSRNYRLIQKRIS